MVIRTAGGYDLLEKIGRGGMGVVYKARQRSLDRMVAVKMISAGELAAPEALRRFRLEAEAAARLQHPGLVAIHEVGEMDGLPFYSMEFVPGGRTLAGLIAEKPMPPHAAAACLEKIARAVQHAHEHGVLHRDLKPSNILLDEQGEPRVTDFGLARQLGSDSSLTLSKNVLGSPAYMPPEQAGGGGGKAGPASDVYSLGAMLYHCVTGRPPFSGESVQTVLLQVREADPVAPRRLNPSLPRDLDTIILKCLEKSPSRRYASAVDFADDLGRFLRAEPVMARPVGMAGRVWRSAHRHPAAAALIVVSVLALAGGLAAALYVNRTLAAGKRSVESALTEKSTALDGHARALVDALISRAESAARLTGQAGQRTAALDAVRKAVERPLTEEEKFRARNAALTALALPEATLTHYPHLPPPGDWTLALCDPAQRIYIRAEYGGKIEIRQVTDGKLLGTYDIGPRRIDCLLTTDQSGAFLAFRFDRTKLGILHTVSGQLLFSAEPWPDPSLFRPGQVTFEKTRLSLPIPGTDLGADFAVVSWPEPDGSIVLAHSRSGIRINQWRRPAPPASTAAIAVPAGPEWTALRISPDGKWMAAAHGPTQTVEIRELLTGKLRSSHPMPSPVHSMQWANWIGRLLVGLADGSVRILETFPDKGLPTTVFPAVEAHSRPVVCVEFGGTGAISSSEDGTIKFWNRRTQEAAFDFDLPAASWRLTYNGRTKRVGPLLQGGVVAFVDCLLSPIAYLHSFCERGGATGPHCVLPDGFAIALLHDQGIDFNGTTKYGTRNLVTLDPVYCAAASPDSSWMLTGHSGKVQRLPIGWLTAEKKSIVVGKPASILTGAGHVTSLALNAKATLLAVADEGANAVRVHPLSAKGTKAGAAQACITINNPMGCSLSPDGKWVAAGSAVPFSAGVWNAGDGVPAAELKSAAAARNWHPVFSKNGLWLAVSGRSCQLFHAGTWESGPELDLPPNGADHHGAAFYYSANSTDGCLLAVVAGDREIHLFRLLDGPPATAKCLAILRLPGEPFVSLPAFDDKGNLTVALPHARMATWNLGEVQKQLRDLQLDW